MKTTMILLATLFILPFALAEDKKPDGKIQTQLTTTDAKKKCKEEGKEGKDLIDCIKDKKGDK